VSKFFWSSILSFLGSAKAQIFNNIKNKIVFSCFCPQLPLERLISTYGTLCVMFIICVKIYDQQVFYFKIFISLTDDFQLRKNKKFEYKIYKGKNNLKDKKYG